MSAQLATQLRQHQFGVAGDRAAARDVLPCGPGLEASALLRSPGAGQAHADRRDRPATLDPRVVDGTSWITGANIHEKHVHSLVAGRDFVGDGVVDVASVRAGDPAPDGSGPVSLARGMEIGHVFQLGRFFAETLGLKVLDENGKLVTVTMGSYGIGVTRILAILAELIALRRAAAGTDA